MNYDEIKEFEEWVRKDASDAQVNMDVIDNEYTLTASYKYSGGKDEIVKNLWPVVNWSRHSITLIWKAKKEFYVEFRDELLNDNMKPLTNDQVIFLLEDDDLYDSYIEDKDALGAWEFEVNDVSFELYNYPDRIEMSYLEYTGKDLSEDIKKSIFDEMNQYVNDNKITEASSTELVWDDIDPEFLKVIVKFKYDETIEGNDFFDAYYKIYNDEGFNFSEKLYTVLDKLGIE